MLQKSQIVANPIPPKRHTCCVQDNISLQFLTFNPPHPKMKHKVD